MSTVKPAPSNYFKAHCITIDAEGRHRVGPSAVFPFCDRNADLSEAAYVKACDWALAHPGARLSVWRKPLRSIFAPRSSWVGEGLPVIDFVSEGE